MNTHGIYQMPLNISDATLKGSENHRDKMIVVANRFQMRIGFDQIKHDAYTLCFDNSSLPFCEEYSDEIVEQSDVVILNEYITYQDYLMRLNSSMTSSDYN